MGIGQKIKDALAVDNGRGYEGSGMPGTFQQQDDGVDYASAHNTTLGGVEQRVDEPRYQGQTNGSSYLPGTTASGPAGTATPGVSAAHNRRYDINEAGTLDTTLEGTHDGTHNAGTQGSLAEPRHSRHKHHDSGVNVGRIDRKDHANDPYWGDVNRSGHHTNRNVGTGGVVLDAASSGTEHLPPPSGEAVGGGDYAAGTGARTGRGVQSGQDPLSETGGAPDAAQFQRSRGTTGTTGTTGARTTAATEATGGPHSAAAVDSYNRQTATRDVAPSSRNNRTQPALTAADAGAATGPGADGGDLRHKNLYATDGSYDRAAGAAPGMPRSTMLDLYGTDHTTKGDLNPAAIGNTASLTSGCSSRISGPESGAAAGGAAETGTTGTGTTHYGPAHEGAKVLHKCHNCGADNDISHYFKKDAVYRIGM